ncbi:S-adenosyl-L-methionine-dependentmethyltransferases superfamily protein [Striga asiatica]|uniref:S-adenosyl-L-methionine-dependentmethyltransferases superfamily protein n=1 Tax=Striga asiatica TaxID=4170 RepID=A0A5A7REX1_STRAF|nr:S-adenosyl-L-methionine-dependentmethyltransferases superfamily protein [Striga asiatica]
MSRPLHRGVLGGGGRFSGNSHDLWEDSQMKEKSEKEDVDRNRTNGVDHQHLSFKFPFRHLFANSVSSKNGLSENSFVSDPFSLAPLRSRHKLTLSLLKFSLVVIVVLAVMGSLWWTLSITSISRGHIYHGYRRLQQQLVSDLYEIVELTIGSSRFRELEYCSQDPGNYVPCFNVSENPALGFSDGEEYGWHCGPASSSNCLVMPPVNYRSPLRWPVGRDVIWFANVNITAQEVLSSGSLTKRMMMLDEDQISFRSVSSTFDVEDYSHQIAGIIGLRNVSYFTEAGELGCDWKCFQMIYWWNWMELDKEDCEESSSSSMTFDYANVVMICSVVRTILDIECGYGSFGAYLSSKQLLTMCVANYEASGSQVQLTLERGLPAMVGSFTSKQLPYPSLSFDMIHCARCRIEWDKKDGIYLIEVDRLLRPGGYFVWTDPLTNSQRSLRNKDNLKRWNTVRLLTESLCWEMLPQQDETVVWKKTNTKKCYSTRKSGSPSLCNKGHDIETPYYRPLPACIGGTQSRRWVPIEERRKWPSLAKLSSAELEIYGLQSEEFNEDAISWNTAVRNYWSLLSPLIFSDHPKRPGSEDPSPPYNMLRNVLDMNARFGGLNAALFETGKSVWVMNVVPTKGLNTLPLIHDRGFVGVLHDWCEPFPTYPRTYDLVHAEGLLSIEFDEKPRCQLLDLFAEVDRILRPEGWLILKDRCRAIEYARSLTTHLKWDARVVEIENNSDERLLICQKPFFKRQTKNGFDEVTKVVVEKLNGFLIAVGNLAGEALAWFDGLKILLLCYPNLSKGINPSGGGGGEATDDGQPRTVQEAIVTAMAKSAIFCFDWTTRVSDSVIEKLQSERNVFKGGRVLRGLWSTVLHLQLVVALSISDAPRLRKSPHADEPSLSQLYHVLEQKAPKQWDSLNDK